MAFRFHPSWQRIFLLFLLGCALLINIHRSPLLLEEPRRALVAMEMLYSGDYLVPSIHSEPYLNKPPFFNWIILLAYQVFGVQDWIPRAISLLSLLGLSWLTYRMARKDLGKDTAWFAALMVPLSADILFYFSFLGEIDLFYALITFGMFYAVYYFGEKEQWTGMFTGVWLLAAIGFLTKGLPSILFTGLTLSAYLLWKGQGKKLFSWKHLLGVSVFILPVGGYFLAYHQRADALAFLQNLFFESANRVGEDSLSLGEHLWRIVYFPFAFSWQYTLPWGLLLWALFHEDFRRKPKPSILIFALLITLVNIWPYALATGTRSRYLYMFFPFVALTAAWIWNEFDTSYGPVFVNRTRRVFSWLALLPLLGWLVFSGLPVSSFILPPAFLWLMIPLSLIAFMVFYGVKNRMIKPLYGFFFTLLLLRSMYGFLLTENRIQNSNAAKDKAIAHAMADIAGGEPVFLDASVRGVSFSIAYYLQKEMKRIVPYTDSTAKGMLLIMDKEQLADQEALLTLPGRDQNLVLIRY